MYKKIIVISFFVVFVGITTWFFIESLTSEKLPLGSNLPSFTYIDTKGTKTIDKNHSDKIIIVIFSINCPFCKTLVTDFDKNISQFSSTRVYLIAKETNLFDVIKKNKLKHISNLLKANNVYFGYMKDKTAEVKFGTSSVPATYVFNKDNKLIKKFKGSTNVNDILK